MPAYVSRTTAPGPAPRRVLAGSQCNVSNAVPRWWCDLSMHVANCARARGPHCPPHVRWSVRRWCSVSPRAEFRGALRVWSSRVRDFADAEFFHFLWMLVSYGHATFPRVRVTDHLFARRTPVAGRPAAWHCRALVIPYRDAGLVALRLWNSLGFKVSVSSTRRALDASGYNRC